MGFFSCHSITECRRQLCFFLEIPKLAGFRSKVRAVTAAELSSVLDDYLGSCER